jgi:hypothetical protein
MTTEIEHYIKVTDRKNLLVTLDQAIAWKADPEKFAFVCDTFGLFAEQEGTIARVERALERLIQENQKKISKKIK